jgi:hypothetical protein
LFILLLELAVTEKLWALLLMDSSVLFTPAGAVSLRPILHHGGGGSLWCFQASYI